MRYVLLALLVASGLFLGSELLGSASGLGGTLRAGGSEIEPDGRARPSEVETPASGSQPVIDPKAESDERRAC